MPVDFNTALARPPAEKVPSPTPPTPPAERGLDIQGYFDAQPKPPTLKEKVGKAVESVLPTARSVGSNLKEMNRALSEQTQEQVFGPIADQFAFSYTDFLEKGRDYQKGQGTLKTLQQGASQLLDIWGMAGSWAAPVQKAVVEPITNEIKRMGEKIAKGDKYTQHDFDALADMFEAGYWTLFGGVPKAGAPGVAAKAGARMGLQEIRQAVGTAGEAAKAPEAKAQFITAQLDKQMGFGKVAEVYAKNLPNLKLGTVYKAKDIVAGMIPHAEGYAKSFLEKLHQHVDDQLQFTTAGQGWLRGNSGHYKSEQHLIEVSQTSDVHTAVHEIVHGATVNMLEELHARTIKEVEAEKGRALTPVERMELVKNPRNPVLKELDDIIKEARIRAAKAGRFQKREDFEIIYALDPMRNRPAEHISEAHPKWQAWKADTPRREFIAQLFSSPQLQEFLANSEKYASVGYKWKNMLNQLSNFIAKHLGMKGHEVQLLSQSMRVGEQLIKMQAVEKPPRTHMWNIIGKLGDEVITEGDIKVATGKPEKPAAIRKAQSSMAISIEQMIRAFSPESLGERAKLAGAVIAKNITELEQKTAAWQWGSRTREKFWRARPDLRSRFVSMFEKGQQFAEPALERLRIKYKDWAHKIFEEDQRRGFTYEERENYLFHAFEDEEGVANYFSRKYGSKWGDPSFTKDRVFDLYDEAIKAGFKPKFENPEDIMLARQHASDVAGMTHQILEDLASFGLAIRKVKTEERFKKVIDAEGKVRFEIERIEGTKQPEGFARWRSPNGDVFWVDPHADQILRNAFKSFSLWGDRGAIGTGFRGMMALKNTIVPIRLALSLFHPLHVAGIDLAAGWTRTSAELLSGHIGPAAALGKYMKNGYDTIFGNPKAGWRVVKAWKGKISASELTAEDAEALKILTETGVAPELSSQYRTNARQNFTNAVRDAMAGFRTGSAGRIVGGTTRATWHAPWAMLSAMQKPIFEQWIPALKAASAIKDAKSLLARNPELMENDAARLLAMRRIGKSVDNRYGEMAYNKLFWQRWAKDLAVLDTLSLGWQLGFIREYGGGALDLGQWAKGEGKLSRIRKGELDKAIFVGTYTTLGAGVAGLMNWAFTGEYPTSLLDWISPRTGEKNADGSDQRVSTMFYSREFAALYKHIQNEGMAQGVSDLVLNKGSGLFGLMHEWGTGVNRLGQEIRDPSADPFTKLEQTLAYTMSDLEPISMKSMQETLTDSPGKMGTLSVLGFTPAPKYLTESKTTADIKTAYRSFVAPKETPYERAEYSKDYTKLREAYQTGSEQYGELLDKMSEQFDLSGKDQRRLIRSLNSPLTSEQRMFMRLPWEEQVKILDRASEDERAALLPHSNREHVRNRWVPPEQRQ